MSYEQLAERAAAFGLESLSDREALTLVLQRAHPTGAATWAQVLLQRWIDLEHVLGADIGSLEALVGRAAALDLKLLHDATRRLLARKVTNRCVLSSWPALTAYLTHVLAFRSREQSRALFLDKRNKLIADELLGEGTIDHAPVYPREVLRRALELGASALILVHNHPSGDPTPSEADKRLTRDVVEGARIFQIVVHDHVVVGRDGIASFKALGLM